MNMLGTIFGFIFVFLIFSILIWQDYGLLFQKHVANGIDGYYYVLQVNSLLENGSLYFQTSRPLILYLLVVPSYFVGNTIIGIKIGALILHGLCCIGIGMFVRTLTGSYWLACLGSLIPAISGLHLYFVSEFLSNLGGLTFLIWGAFGVAKSIQTKKKTWCAFVIIMISAAIFSHRSMVWLILGLFLVTLLLYVWRNRASYVHRRHSFFIFLTIFLITPSIWAWQPFFILPEWLSLEISKYPLNPFRRLILMESLVLIVIISISLVFLFVKPRLLYDSLAGQILFLIVTWTLLITFNPFLNHHAGLTGVTPRLDLNIYLLVAVAIPLLLSVVSRISNNSAFILGTILLPFLLYSWLITLPLGLQPRYLQTRENLIAELPLMIAKTCRSSLIIARHGDQFLITSTLLIQSQNKAPTEDKFGCVLWLLRQPDADYQLVFENSVASSRGDFVLLEDSEMRRQLQGMPKDELRTLLQENLHLSNLVEHSTR